MSQVLRVPFVRRPNLGFLSTGRVQVHSVGYSMLGMVARSLSMRRHSSVEIPRDRYRVTAMLSASVEISLVYQVTSPLACLPEDEMMPRSSRMKRSRME